MTPLTTVITANTLVTTSNTHKEIAYIHILRGIFEPPIKVSESHKIVHNIDRAANVLAAGLFPERYYSW